VTVRPEVVEVLTDLIPVGGQPLHAPFTTGQKKALASATPEEEAEAVRQYVEKALKSADPPAALLPVIEREMKALFEQFAAEQADA
jgi:hypothetical protein